MKPNPLWLQIDERPRLLDGRTELAKSDAQAFDFAEMLAVMRTVQAIGAETDLKGLLRKLMKLIIDVSGAERGVLVLRRGDEGEIELAHGFAMDGSLPQSLIRYVMNSQEVMVLDRPGGSCGDGTVDEFDGDPYFASTQPVSVLCHAIGRHPPIQRALYLEHRSLSQVFTGKRRQLVGWLVVQAAISIDNAQLYSKLEEEVSRRTQVLINLLGNAAKFTRQGSVLLAVDVLDAGQDGRCWLRFAVTDTGPGMAAEEQVLGA